MSSLLPIHPKFTRDPQSIPPINLQRHLSFNIWVGFAIITGLMTWAICTKSDEMIAYLTSLIK